MRRLKAFVFLTGLMLLILSAVSFYVSLQGLREIRPAESYEDRGVRAFRPYEVLPVQVQNTGATGRDRRMHPTKTVYKVYYRATDGSGYRWSKETYSRSQGQKIVDAGETVERRVLSIPEDGTYITVEPDQTARSYTEGLRGRCNFAAGLATVYIILYIAVWISLRLVRRLRTDPAEDTELERFTALSRPVYSGPEIPDSRPRFYLGKALLIALPVLLALLVLTALWAAGRRSREPAALDYGWEGDIWTCAELDLRFTLPKGGEAYDLEEVEAARWAELGPRWSAGQTILAAADYAEGSTLSLAAVQGEGPSEASLLETVASFARRVAGEGSYDLETEGELTVAGQAWRAWRVETPESGLVHYYLYRQSGAYWLVIACYGPLSETPPALLACFDGENTVGVTPANAYLPPAGEDGYLTATFPPSLLGNKTPEELLAEFHEACSGMTREELEAAAFSGLTANEDGSVSYYFTPEQYQRSKKMYYAWGTRTLSDFFGLDPSEIIRRMEYTEMDESGIPWGVDVWVNQAAFREWGAASDFLAAFVPMTMIGRYQVMCGVSGEAWSVHVTLRDADSGEAITEETFPAEAW